MWFYPLPFFRCWRGLCAKTIFTIKIFLLSFSAEPGPVKIDPTLASIKERLKQRQEAEMAKKKEEEENRKKQQWTTATLAPVEDNSTKSSDSAKEISEKEKLDPIRPAFAMQMGLKGAH